MSVVVSRIPMNFGSHFRVVALRGGEMTEPIPHFLGVGHARIGTSTVPPRPHAGYSTVSNLFLESETAIENHDSLGNHNPIQSGSLHWIATGCGVLHEVPPVEAGKAVHMLKIFANLGRGQPGNKPFASSLASQEVPTVELPDAKIRARLGSHGTVAHSPLKPSTNVGLLEVALNQGAELSIPIASSRSAFVTPIHCLNPKEKYHDFRKIYCRQRRIAADRPPSRHHGLGHVHHL